MDQGTSVLALAGRIEILIVIGVNRDFNLKLKDDRECFAPIYIYTRHSIQIHESAELQRQRLAQNPA